ncbi:unnamed protein product [Closterium sp. Yama58-4]|nr:unnamed protein product [Closterium sp. Yama58-4]
MRLSQADFKALEAIILQQEQRYMVEGINLPHAQRYSLQQLHDATNGFDDKLLLGEGGFGKVYKGVLNGEAVAIKMATKMHQHDGKAFKNEIKLLTKAAHRNLVQLRGFCVENDEQLLVFEFMEGGALNEWITGGFCSERMDHGWVLHQLWRLLSLLLGAALLVMHPWCEETSDGKRRLTWLERIRIAQNVASALRYLHSDLLNGESEVHGDIKPDNILLTAEPPMEAKVADFGTSKTLPERGELVVEESERVGTRPYVDPEYDRSGKLTEYSDVYSFGVVLLQLATGQRPVIRSDQGNVPLRQYVWRLTCTTDGLSSVVDPCLRGAGEGSGGVSAGEMVAGREETFDKLLRLALWCTLGRPSDRPKMVDVESALRDIETEADAAAAGGGGGGGFQAVQQQHGVALAANGLSPQRGPGLVTVVHPPPSSAAHGDAAKGNGFAGGSHAAAGGFTTEEEETEAMTGPCAR